MTTARTFLRLVLAGVMVNMLAAACIVNSEGGDGDDEGSCEPNTYKACTCTDGTASERKCNASGTAWGTCACDGSSSGGSGNGSEGGNGPAPAQGGEGNTAGTTSTTYGGESSGGGMPGGDGGMTSVPGEGGAGGAGEVVEPGICDGDPNDSCADCYQQGCCDQWTACADDATCLDEFLDIMAECADLPRADHNVTTAEFEACVADFSANAGGWSSGISPLTADMVDCVAGDDADGWEGQAWGSLACKAGCFDQQ
jgi:hypothetical protein